MINDDYIEYKCSCEEFNNNVNNLKEVHRYVEEKQFNEMMAIYDPKIHGTEPEYMANVLIDIIKGTNKVKEKEEKLKNKNTEKIIKTKRKKHNPAIRVEHIASGNTFPSISSCAKYYKISIDKIKKEEGINFRFLKG